MSKSEPPPQQHVRRQGVGRNALRLLRQELIPGQRVSLEVLNENVVAQRFWKANGFRAYAITLELIPAHSHCTSSEGASNVSRMPSEATNAYALAKVHPRTMNMALYPWSTLVKTARTIVHQRCSTSNADSSP